LVKHGADVNARNRYGATPLHEAADGGNASVVELLLDSGADLNARNGLGSTPLHVAAYKGNLSIVELLLRRGADPNSRNMYGSTPLHEAASNSHAGVVRLLLENGADPSIRNKDGKTALNLARESGHVEVAELIEKFVSPSILDIDSTDIFIDEWSELAVKVRGMGRASIAIEGDIDWINPGNIDLSEEPIVKIPVRAKRIGKVPVKVVLRSLEKEDFRIVWLNVKKKTKKCPSCGAEVEPGAKYCWRCGAKLG